MDVMDFVPAHDARARTREKAGSKCLYSDGVSPVSVKAQPEDCGIMASERGAQWSGRSF